MRLAALLGLTVAVGAIASDVEESQSFVYGVPGGAPARAFNNELHWRTVVRRGMAFNEEALDRKRFQGEVLGYSTPWNGDGKLAAAQFAAKLTFAVPVWLQLRNGPESTPLTTVPSDVTNITVTGTHEVDAEWVQTLQAAGTLVVPRVIWEAGALSPPQAQESINRLVDLVRQHKWDGLTIEMPHVEEWGSWVQRLCTRLHALPLFADTPKFDSAVCIAVLPAPQLDGEGNAVGGVTPELFRTIAAHVDRVSLMTYDFSVRQQRQGPNSPTQWATACITSLLGALNTPEFELRAKILMGVPFYSYDYGSPLTGAGVLELMEQHKPQVYWDALAEEHYFVYQGEVSMEDGELKKVNHVVYFPTLPMIRLRSTMANRLGIAGLAVWELGQGLPGFFDVL